VYAYGARRLFPGLTQVPDHIRVKPQNFGDFLSRIPPGREPPGAFQLFPVGYSPIFLPALFDTDLDTLFEMD
jgi:hypothetical protein